MSSTSIFLSVGVNYINIYVIIFHVDVYIMNAYVLKATQTKIICTSTSLKRRRRTFDKWVLTLCRKPRHVFGHLCPVALYEVFCIKLFTTERTLSFEVVVVFLTALKTVQNCLLQHLCAPSA